MSAPIAFFPHRASTIASEVDGVTFALLILSGLLILLVAGMIVTFVILYREGSPRSREIIHGGQTLLEWSWTFATFFAFMGLFAWGAVTYFKMHVPPRDASEILVVGKQWMWKFQHPNGKREIDELHVPVGVPILLTMTSQDVIHSLFVPEFRVKQDVVPGRYTRMWFQANREGQFHLFCTQYCGTMHAGMRGKVIAMSQQAYQRWLQTGISATATLASRGARLFTRLGCISCHANNPGALAPPLQGIFGKSVGLSDGTTVIADEGYLRESILNPKAKIVQGYPPIMPSFQGQVGEEDILDLISYIKSLRGTPQGAAPEGTTP